ncbi:MAG TPA: Imm50 family immunity protein [Trichormus sp.]|jgi:hypothetical protein
MQLENLPGAIEVINWFGYMPSFHDAEVIEICLRRDADSSIAVHCWHTSNELDEHGNFVQIKDAVVTFILTEVSDLALNEFNQQNVIFSLDVTSVDDGFVLEMQGSYGVAGTISAKSISVRLLAGKPSRGH